MASAARGSGAGGGDRCPSGEKGTTPVSVYISGDHTHWIPIHKFNWNTKV